jgi:hypothetical protein
VIVFFLRNYSVILWEIYGSSILCGTVTDSPTFTYDKVVFGRGGGAVKGQTLKITFLSCIILYCNVIIHC